MLPFPSDAYYHWIYFKFGGDPLRTAADIYGQKERSFLKYVGNIADEESVRAYINDYLSAALIHFKQKDNPLFGGVEGWSTSISTHYIPLSYDGPLPTSGEDIKLIQIPPQLQPGEFSDKWVSGEDKEEHIGPKNNLKYLISHNESLLKFLWLPDTSGIARQTQYDFRLTMPLCYKKPRFRINFYPDETIDSSISGVSNLAAYFEK